MLFVAITLSSDLRGFSRNATVIASVLRRTALQVSVKCYCQGFLPLSFKSDRLSVEFMKADRMQTGCYPSHVGSAVFDRLQVIRDAEKRDRCLIMNNRRFFRMIRNRL